MTHPGGRWIADGKLCERNSFLMPLNMLLGICLAPTYVQILSSSRHALTELLFLLPSLRKFWTKVRIKFKESYLQETKDDKVSVNKFLSHDTNTVPTDIVKGESETFY